MNCEYFEAVIIDLARDQIMDAAARESALSHAGGCAPCAARLGDERALTVGLGRMAEVAKVEEAPARVEGALLAAFREERVSRLAPAITLPPTRAHRWVLWALGAAAAMFLVLLAAAALRFEQTTPPARDQEARNEQAPPVKNDEPRDSAPRHDVTPINHKHSIEQRASNRMKRRARGASKTNRSNQYGPDTEIATDFLPLMHRESLGQMDGGQVVRVELPRSALMSFGLPMNVDRAGERIKADVVVGSDGLARAIRFVR